MPKIDLPDDELAAVIAAIRGVIEDDRYPRAPRLDPLRAALARFEAATPEPAPQPKASSAGKGGRAKPMNAKQELIRELEKRGLRDMARKARDGEYSYMDSLRPLPVAVLAQELEAAGHHDLAARARNGDFDHER
jgi:hypothetical protein